jgi:hypothetical protein
LSAPDSEEVTFKFEKKKKLATRLVTFDISALFNVTAADPHGNQLGYENTTLG